MNAELLTRFRNLCAGMSQAPGMYGSPAECAAMLYGAGTMLGLSREEWYATPGALGLTRGNRVLPIETDATVRALAGYLSETAPRWVNGGTP